MLMGTMRRSVTAFDRYNIGIMKKFQGAGCKGEGMQLCMFVNSRRMWAIFASLCFFFRGVFSKSVNGV